MNNQTTSTLHIKIKSLLIIIFLYALPNFAHAGNQGTPVSGGVAGKLYDLESRVITLERRVVGPRGFTAAVYEGNGFSGRAAPVGSTSQTEISIAFCPEDLIGDCDDYSAGALILRTGLFDKTASKSIFSFDKSYLIFESIVDLLTNGNGKDRLGFFRETCINDCTVGGGGSGVYTNDYNFFFAKQQPSTVAGYVDLEGLEVTQIHIAIDRYTESYDSSSGQLKIDLDYRVLFEVAM